MPLREVIQQHPVWLGIACMAWTAVAVWVVSLVGWMIQGEVDALFGLAGIGVGVALGYFSFNPPTESLRVFMALSIVVTAIAYPFVRAALTKRALVAIDVEAMEDAYELLRLKPDNHSLKLKIARILYERGQVQPALAIGIEASKHLSENLFAEEHRMVGRWRRQNPAVKGDRPILCSNCGHPNASGTVFCESCQAPYLLDLARGAWVGREFARKLIAAWVAGILALAGIPLASSLPPAAAIIVIVAIMAGAIFLLWTAFRVVGEAQRA